MLILRPDPHGVCRVRVQQENPPLGWCSAPVHLLLGIMDKDQHGPIQDEGSQLMGHSKSPWGTRSEHF